MGEDISGLTIKIYSPRSKWTVRNKQDFQTFENLAWACSQNVTSQKPRAVAKR